MKLVDAEKFRSRAEEESPLPIFNVGWVNQIPSPETVSLLSEPNHIAATITTRLLSSVINNIEMRERLDALDEKERAF
jgi:hypothetical protein